MTNKTEVVLTETSWEGGQAPLSIDSREIAKMMNVRHADLLRSIKKYEAILTNAELRSLDFFLKSGYVDAKGELREGYELTRKGCDMVANKMTGEKGILFTAAYVTKFEEMEKEITMSKFNLPSTFKEALLLLVEAEEEKERLIASNNEKEEIIQIQAPKVELYNEFLNTDNLYTVNDIAKTLAIKGLGRNNLYKWLKWNKILIDTNEAYQRFINAGYIVHRNVPYSVPVYEWKDGKKKQKGYEKRIEMKVYFTAKGVAWLYNKLVSSDYKIDKTCKVVIEELNSLQEKENN